MASPEPVQDHALTKRVENASKLLSACQEAFDVDVYKKDRISNQQKLEKEVFPECIQAPVKYSNKRKSLKMSLKKDKENQNLSILPGENISPLPVKHLKRDKPHSYVQDWLDKIEVLSEKPVRKPLSVLNANSNYEKLHVNQISPLKRRADVIMGKFFESETCIKRKYSNKTEKDESGIVIDDIIDDSEDEILSRDEDSFNFNKQSKQTPLPVVDKDQQAWLAVLEAEKMHAETDAIPKLECSEVIIYTDDIEKSVQANSTQESDFIISKEIIQPSNVIEQSLQTKKTQENHDVTNTVPFYKKSYLVEPNTDKKSFLEKTDTSLPQISKPKNVEITIESKSFVTTIKVMNVEKQQRNKKQSILVQTDISSIQEPNEKLIEVETAQISTKEVRTNKEVEKKDVDDSLDLFTAEKVSNERLKPDVIEEPKQPEIQSRPVSKTVISDSDSDDCMNKSQTLIVRADVHRSSDQSDYGVFSELRPSELSSRPRKRKQRGNTPNSSDSSDKENRDPNRAKRNILAKKGKETIKKNRKKLGVVN